MIPVGTALNATKGLVHAGQLANQTVNALNTADSVLNKLLPEGEGQMPAKDETTYTTAKTVLTDNVMIEILSNNLAMDLLRPDEHLEAQSFLARLLLSCCFPPKPLLKVRVSDPGLQEALKMARDPAFDEALKTFRRVTTGMGEKISQAAWVAQVMIVLIAQITQDSSPTHVQLFSITLNAITDKVVGYYQELWQSFCLPGIEYYEVNRLYDACEEHKPTFDTYASRVPEFDWRSHYQQLSGYLNSLSKAIKKKIAIQIIGDQAVKLFNSILYTDWKKDLVKLIGKEYAAAMMMSLNEYENFKSLIRANRSMLFQVGDAIDEGVIFYVSTLNDLVDFLLDCLTRWEKIQSKLAVFHVSPSLWWLNLMVDLSLAMIDGVSDNALFNTPFSRAILENTNKRLQCFRQLDQQHRTMPYLSETIDSISGILGHNDKQFNVDNPVMTAMARILLNDHDQFTIEKLIHDLRSVIHYAFSSNRSDRSVFFEEKMQFRLYVLAHQLVFDEYKDKARLKMRTSPFAIQVVKIIEEGLKKINQIDHIATQHQGRTQARQYKDEFKTFIVKFKQAIEGNLFQPGRSIKMGGYAYSFFMLLSRWGLAYLHSEMKQVQQEQGVLMLPFPLPAERLVVNRSADLFNRPVSGHPIANTDIRVDLALSHLTSL